MRKLIVSMNITRDGFMAGPNCELDWHFGYWNEEMADYAGKELGKADSILLGKTTYCALARYWPARMHDLLCPREDIAFTTLMNDCEKIVCSDTLPSVQWNNSRIIRGPIQLGISDIKARQGKNIIIYGSGQIVSALTPLSAIDEFQLWVHPVRIDKGKPLFADARMRNQLRLYHTKKFRSGVVLGHYKWAPETVLT